MTEETLLTNRELAKWLAQGNGEILIDVGEFDIIHTMHEYASGTENHNVDNFKIRKWSDTKWHKPTKEYIAPKGYYETRPSEGVNYV